MIHTQSFIRLLILLALFFIVVMIKNYRKTKVDYFNTKSKNRDQNEKENPIPLQLKGFSHHSSDYQVLNISENSNAKQIQEACRKLLKKYHPDFHDSLSEDEKKELQKITQRILLAKERCLKKLNSNRI